MVEYICKRCNESFDHKAVYEKHINRKYKCVPQMYNSKTNKRIEHKCVHCKRNFSRKDSLARHLSICKNKNGKTKIINNTKNGENIVNTGNNTKTLIKKNNCNNRNNNIYKFYGPVILIPFGKDGIECIDLKTFKKIVDSKQNIIESIISNVNFDPDKPQHHNIFYGDIKSSYGEVFEKNKWVKMKIDEILDTLIEAKIGDLSDILNDYADILSKRTRNKIKQTIENMDYSKPGARKKLKTYLKPILYNHKEMIIKTRKLTKEQEEEIFRKEQEEAEREAEEEEIALKQKNEKKLRKKSDRC
jgi:hypothetical protein